MLFYKLDGHGRKSLSNTEFASIINNNFISNGNTEDDGMVTIKFYKKKK